MNEALNNIYTRASVRKFTDQKVEKEKIDNILKAAMSAPSAVNRQPWDFIVVDDKEVLDKLEKAKDYCIQDCSSATTNILLAVHAQGLGAVWTGVYNGDKKVASVQNILELPKHPRTSKTYHSVKYYTYRISS